MSKIVAPVERLRQKLRKGQAALGLWVTMESPTVSELAARIGLDGICIDTEHAELDLQEVANHLRCLRGSSTVTFVRIPDIQ